MHKTYRNRLAIRFRRWSRKRYAMFCSVGRQVTIGMLSKSVTEASLGKQRGVMTTEAGCLDGDRVEREEDDSGGLSGLIPGQWDVLLQPQMLVKENDCAVGSESLRCLEYRSGAWGEQQPVHHSFRLI